MPLLGLCAVIVATMGNSPAMEPMDFRADIARLRRIARRVIPLRHGAIRLLIVLQRRLQQAALQQAALLQVALQQVALQQVALQQVVEAVAGCNYKFATS